LGRPEGKSVPSLSLKPIEARLRELTQVPFELRENLRFDPREEQNDEAFAKELALLGDIYVNEAFSDSHRAHASIVGIPKFIPGFAGLHFMEEVERLTAALTPPKSALALIGGAKFDTKIPLMQKLLSLYSEVLVGGALANDLLKARGLPFGSSLISSTPVPPELAAEDRLVMPGDAMFGQEGGTERSGSVVDIRATESLNDIGPVTSAAWAKKVTEAPFVLWNGPMGLYEKGYTGGTDAIAAALASNGKSGVVGGGDTTAAIAKFSFDSKKIFVSTGGGAMLQFLADGTLPGIEALTASRE
jgi:phosphoglycerate kinase